MQRQIKIRIVHGIIFHYNSLSMKKRTSLSQAYFSRQTFAVLAVLLGLVGCNDTENTNPQSQNKLPDPKHVYTATVPGLTPAKAGERSVRIASYNVWGVRKPFLKEPGRLSIIHRLISLIDADVVGFQETADDLTRILSTTAGFPYHAWGPLGGEDKVVGSGLLTISRWPIVASSTHTYQSCTFPNCIEAKGALFIRVRFEDGSEADIYNTHTLAGPTDKARTHQIREFCDFIGRNSADGTRPVIAVGDFNATPDSNPYRVMEEQCGMRDSQREYVDQTPGLGEAERDGYTWNAERNPNARMPFAEDLRQRIDYVWFRPTIDGYAQTSQVRLLFDQPVDGTFLSDHFGVLTDLKLSLKNLK